METNEGRQCELDFTEGGAAGRSDGRAALGGLQPGLMAGFALEVGLEASGDGGASLKAGEVTADPDCLEAGVLWIPQL